MIAKSRRHAFSILTLLFSASVGSAAVTLAGASVKKEALIWNLQAELHKFITQMRASPNHETKETHAQGTRAARAADALTDFYSSNLMNRTDALILVRVATDFANVDNAEVGSIFADLTKKQVVWKALLNECTNRPTKKLLAHQEALVKYGFTQVTEEDLCELKEQLREMDEAERNGNG